MIRPHTLRAARILSLAGMLSFQLLSSGAGASSAPTKASVRPNILFVYLDDFGWRDAGFAGSDFYETPNLDRLAVGGTIFTDAYSCAANCAPARACLLSGQYSPRHRVFNVGTRARGKAAFRRLRHVPGTSTLRPDIVTWAECLQASGYRTGMFGKWHLGTTPQNQGFDVAVEFRKLPGFKAHRGPNGEYLADVLTDRTVDFIRENREEPWCAYLAHFAVHTPLQPKRELLNKYRNKEPGKLHSHVAMATMIEAVDTGVGRIVAELEKLGLRERTMILFTSDNGGFGPATDMAPLRGYKGTYYEGGIREPFFVNWPGTVPANRRCADPIIGVDIYPTLLDVAGIERPDQPLDGVSLLPLFRGDVKAIEQRPLFWHFPAYLESYSVWNEQRDPLFRTRPCSVVRFGKYKLHHYFEKVDWELYDLEKDVGESTNLADVNKATRQQLQRIMDDWHVAVGAPVPLQPNPRFDAAAEAAAIAKKQEQEAAR